MGETGELVIGGVGLARYLDAEKDAEKFAPLPSLGWERAYRSGDIVRAEPSRAAVPRPRRRAGQARRAADRAGRGRRRAAGAARRRRRGRRGAPHRGPATRCWSGTWSPRRRGFDADAAALAAARAAARRAGAAARGGRRRCRPARPGKVDRDALPWPLPDSGPTAGAAGLLTPTEGWLAERLGGDPRRAGRPTRTPTSSPTAAAASTAAQLVARIRTRHPQVSVDDVYQHPTLGALAARLDALDATTDRPRREVAPDAAPRRRSSRPC